MDISQIRGILHFLVAFLNLIFALILWTKGKKNKLTYYAGWLAFFATIYAFTWGMMYFFEKNRFFWARATSLGVFNAAAYIVFVYYFTNRLKHIKLKAPFWYLGAALVAYLFLVNPNSYFFGPISPEYPYIIKKSYATLNPIVRVYAIFSLGIALYYLLKDYAKSQGFRRLQIEYFILGFFIYSGIGGFFATIAPLLYPGFTYLDLSSFFSIFWVGLTTYAIFKRKLFGIRVILTEILVGLVALIILVQFFLAPTPGIKFLQFLFFFLFAWFGYLLIHSTYQEIEKKEEAEKLSRALQELNETLEEKVQERTQELALAKDSAETERDKTLSIINNFADGLLVLNKQTTVIMTNPQVEGMVGLPQKELIGKKLKTLTKNTFFNLLNSIILTNDKLQKVSRQEFSPQKEITFEVTATSLIHKTKPIGHLVIIHDISREKIIERLKTEFVSLAAHQLRTPLSEIKWSLKMFLDGDFGKIDKEQKKIMGKTYASNERMIALVNDLLNVTRIEEGRYVVDPVSINIDEVIQKIINSLKDKIKNKQLNLEFKKPEEKLPNLLLDAEKIELVIQNLVENAIRYNISNGKIIINLKKNNNTEVEFSIKDTGVGIPRKQQSRIFSKFFRADNVVKLETEGNGLGLFITKNIIEAHQGKIWFESEEGKGATFYFTLPLKDHLIVKSEEIVDEPKPEERLEKR